MAHYVVNPKTSQVSRATKKGTTNSGMQRWKDTVTGESFTTEFMAENQVDQQTAEVRGHASQGSWSNQQSATIGKSPGPTSSSKTPKTEIYVNNNRIKQINGDLDIKDATELVGGYFREVSESNAEVKQDQEGNKRIVFAIRSGNKS